MKNDTIKWNRGIHLDPRTKLFLVVVMAVVVLSPAGNGRIDHYLLPVLSLLPYLLLCLSGHIKDAVRYAILFGVFMLLQLVLIPYAHGLIRTLLTLACYLVLRFMPTVMIGYYTVATTTVSEFNKAMDRLHVPEQITIPMSVMFRFFPTIKEEASSINDSMRMRGISFGGGKPSKVIEYRLVPLLMCSVRIGEELSQAALTRGLGAPVRRTNICRIGFQAQDYVMLAIGIASVVLHFIPL